MKFIGRATELKLLEKEYSSNRGSFVPVYGRRRIGKSQLLVEFTRDKPVLYFTALHSTNTQHLKTFWRQAARVTGIESLESAADWETLLQDTFSGRRSCGTPEAFNSNCRFPFASLSPLGNGNGKSTLCCNGV
jgi:AAA+ ATPase superfamily predicted ATPase